MIKNILVIGLFLFFFVAASQNFTASYSFAAVTGSSGTTDPSLTPTVNGLSFGSFKAIGCSPNANASGRFSFTGWPVGAIGGSDSYSQFTGAPSAFIYYEVKIFVVPTFSMHLKALSFAVRRSGTGIRNYSVRSNVDNFSSDLAASTGTNSKLSVVPTNVFFWNYDSVSTASDQRGSVISFSGMPDITDSITFRFYAWNAETNNGTFSIDNVSFSGTLTDTVPDDFTKTDDLRMDHPLNVYPNPASHKLFLSKNVEVISIINSDGKLMGVEQSYENGLLMIDLERYLPGFYFLRYKDAGMYKQIRVVRD